MEQPIILCGLGRMGMRVLDYLQAAGLPVVVVDTRCRPDDPVLKGGPLVSGDCRRREVLEAAGVANARGVLILTGDDLLNISATLMVRALNPNVRIVMRMFNQNLLGRLGNAVKNVFALSTAMLTAPVVAVTALTGQGLGTFRIDGAPDGLRQVAELTVGPASPQRGQKIVQVAGARVLVVAHMPAGAKPRYLIEVDLEATLATGDRLVLCAQPRVLADLLESDNAARGDLHWASWLRRQGRALRQTVDTLDKAVIICTAILLGVVCISTMVLHFGADKTSWPKAFARTISIMATVASLHEDEYGAGMQIFVSSLRIIGAALMAAFTAIVTHYLLRARLGGALEVSRVPEGGHVVVCGLGPIGFLVVEELVASGQRVVVIELAADNRFAATVRRLKVPVIIGDAAVLGVLRHAHAASARAVVAATSHDLINLEVALLVRELNASQRIVAVDYQLAPVALLPALGPVSEQPFAARLGAGDRLIAIVALADLEKLSRRQPAPLGFAVEIDNFPLPTRGWLAGLVRTEMGLGAKEADHALDQLPLRLRSNVTRGQAEDLLVQLVRERVAARIVVP